MQILDISIPALHRNISWLTDKTHPFPFPFPPPLSSLPSVEVCNAKPHNLHKKDHYFKIILCTTNLLPVIL